MDRFRPPTAVGGMDVSFLFLVLSKIAQPKKTSPKGNLWFFFVTGCLRLLWKNIILIGKSSNFSEGQKNHGLRALELGKCSSKSYELLQRSFKIVPKKDRKGSKSHSNPGKYDISRNISACIVVVAQYVPGVFPPSMTQRVDTGTPLPLPRTNSQQDWLLS